jgi:hypothetical protein
MALARLTLLIAFLVLLIPTGVAAQDFGAPGVPAAVMTMAFAASAIVRAVIDAIRTGVEMPRWMPVLMVFLLGQVFVFALIVAGGTRIAAMNESDYMTVFLAGVLAGAMAILNNTLAAKAIPTKPPNGPAAQTETPLIPGTPQGNRGSG